MDARYNVVVRNELTGETTTVSLQSDCSQEAQIAALVLLFKNEGWRKAVAFQPEAAPLSAGTP